MQLNTAQHNSSNLFQEKQDTYEASSAIWQCMNAALLLEKEKIKMNRINSSMQQLSFDAAHPRLFTSLFIDAILPKVQESFGKFR